MTVQEGVHIILYIDHVFLIHTQHTLHSDKEVYIYMYTAHFTQGSIYTRSYSCSFHAQGNGWIAIYDDKL